MEGSTAERQQKIQVLPGLQAQVRVTNRQILMRPVQTRFSNGPEDSSIEKRFQVLETKRGTL